jgi:two-component system chemotaxis response regulator CheB
MAAEEIRVLVVDDSAVIRSLIAGSIGSTPGMKVVGAAEDGRQALELLDSARPDAFTLDIQVPRMDGGCEPRRPFDSPPAGATFF